jgi:hypothetical protein
MRHPHVAFYELDRTRSSKRIVRGHRDSNVTGGAAAMQRKEIPVIVNVVARPIHAIFTPEACLFEMRIFVPILSEAKCV